MTVNKALAKSVGLLGDTVPREMLLEWLCEIENTVVREISATHENHKGDTTLITGDGDGERELFAPDPYSNLYINYILMKCDQHLRDSEGYLNSSRAFFASYSDFADYYNRENMPKSIGGIKL